MKRDRGIGTEHALLATTPMSTVGTSADVKVDHHTEVYTRPRKDAENKQFEAMSANATSVENRGEERKERHSTARDIG